MEFTVAHRERDDAQLQVSGHDVRGDLGTPGLAHLEAHLGVRRLKRGDCLRQDKRHRGRAAADAHAAGRQTLMI